MLVTIHKGLGPNGVRILLKVKFSTPTQLHLSLSLVVMVVQFVRHVSEPYGQQFFIKLPLFL